MTETGGMDLATFLLARIAEDEAQLATARRMGVPPMRGSRMWSGIGNHPTVGEERLAAECEAKRRIVNSYALADVEVRRCIWDDEAKSTRDALAGALRWVALPYADHPDYQQEWTP